jgi:hypothetical protein
MIRTGVIAAIVVGAVSVALPTPSLAAGSPTISYFSCANDGSGTFECSVYWSGGTAPYTLTWGGSGVRYTYKSSNNTSGFVEGTCATKTTDSMSVVVTDSTGASASAHTTMYCSPNP